jgi:hypothetical protein
MVELMLPKIGPSNTLDGEAEMQWRRDLVENPEKLAKAQIKAQPDEDSNEIRALYALDPLDAAEMVQWLESPGGEI